MEPPANDKEPGVNRLTGQKRKPFSNPDGRPIGSKSKTKSWKVEERLRYKHKRNPLDELIKVADALFIEKKYDEAGDIWMFIQKFCEASKKPVETKDEKKSPEDSLKAAKKTFDLVKELEKDFDNANTGATGTGDTASLGHGKPDVQAEASSEENLPDNKGQ